MEYCLTIALNFKSNTILCMCSLGFKVTMALIMYLIYEELAVPVIAGLSSYVELLPLVCSEL